jgi:hypothetical protein
MTTSFGQTVLEKFVVFTHEIREPQFATIA